MATSGASPSHCCATSSISDALRDHGRPVNTGYGDAYKTSANPFLYRFKDELLVKGTIRTESIYAVIKAERNFAQGITVLFGGMIAESIRQNTEAGQTENWTTSVVTKEEYLFACEQ